MPGACSFAGTRGESASLALAAHRAMPGRRQGRRLAQEGELVIPGTDPVGASVRSGHVELPVRGLRDVDADHTGPGGHVWSTD